LALFGSEGYGQRQGKVMSARLAVSSAAPFALAFLMGNIGVSWSLSITAALGAAAVAAVLAIRPLMRMSAPAQTALARGRP
jgi:hypothetical protein